LVASLLRGRRLVRRVQPKPSLNPFFSESNMPQPSISCRSRSRLARLLLALTLGVSAVAALADPFESAYSDFTQARAGNASAIERSADAFSVLLKAEPTNPLLMAYAGASASLRATTTWLPWRKMRFAEDGLAQLDKALALLSPAHNTAVPQQVPAALEVRYVAAATFLAVPGFMNRGARGKKLLTEVADSPLLATAPVSFRGDVWLRAADLAFKDDRQSRTPRSTSAHSFSPVHPRPRRPAPNWLPCHHEYHPQATGTVVACHSQNLSYGCPCD
jgi:hypothetical protein